MRATELGAGDRDTSVQRYWQVGERVCGQSSLIVSELDHARIAELRSQGYRVLRVISDWFSEANCKIDGFVMVKRA